MKLALLCVLAVVLRGQIAGLVTTWDGAEVEFLSSLGTGEDGETVMRHYRYRAGTPETLYRAVDWDTEWPMALVLSDDGATRGRVSFCRDLPGLQVIVTRQGRTTGYVARGVPVFSRNGRWMYDPGDQSSGKASLIDLDTGKTMGMEWVGYAYGSRMVADDGTVVGVDRGRLVVEGAERVTLPVLPDGDGAAAISADGRRVIAWTPFALFSLERGGVAWRELYRRNKGGFETASPSADGARVLLKLEREVVMVDSSGARTWYLADEMVLDAVLAGDGRTAYLTTQSNRLIRIREGEAEELYSAFPSVGPLDGGVFPGSLVRLGGDPMLAGTVLTVGGRDFPIVATGPDDAAAQVPWDFDQKGIIPYRVTRGGSPFVRQGPLEVEERPTAMIYSDYVDMEWMARVARQDFRTLVTKVTPASAGETIHFWLTGLGPLDRPVATGEKGPANPPARPLAPFACYIYNDTEVRGLEIPFVAYAPGMVGLYQVDARIPADWPAGLAYLTCAVGADPPRSSAGIYVGQ